MSTTSAERMRRLRERRSAGQAAAVAAVPDAVRDPDELLLPAVEVTIAALGLGERDQAVAQLARVLARAIDNAADQAVALRVLGPQLLKVLTAIGGTPAAQARMGTGRKQPERAAPSRLAQLRAEHLNSAAKRKRAAHGTGR